MKRKISTIVLHCTANKDNPHCDDIKIIDQIHRKERGWKMVGYHYHVKFSDGTIQLGRPHEMVGAHCENFNKNSIGIALSGEHFFSQLQFDSLFMLCKNLINDYDLCVSDIYGHNELNPHKTCPNFNVEAFRKCLDLNRNPMKVDMMLGKDF